MGDSHPRGGNVAFCDDGYSVLSNLVPDPPRSFLDEYARKLALTGRLDRGDVQVADAPYCYADPFMEALMVLLLPRIEAETGRKLFPTYTYFRLYRRADQLPRHTDRPSCEFSVTLCLGFEAFEPWPIFIETRGGERALSLTPGDGLLYRGTELAHWRHPFRGESATQVFLHYVDQEGPFRDWRYDKRSSLPASPIAERILGQFRTVLQGPLGST